MPTIGNAPNGEKTVLDGTEKVPLSGSFWSYISTIKTYIQGFFVRLTGDESIAGNKTFTGYTTFNPSTDSDGTIAAYAETNYNDYGYYVAQYSADSADFDKSSMVLYRERDADGNFTGPMIYGVQYNGSSDSFIVQGDFLNFENDNSTVFNVDKDGVVNIQSGSTYNINGIPHTHLSSAVNDSDVIFTDNTENNSSSDAHGYLPKLAGNTTDFLRADGSWATPPAGGSVFDSDVIFTDNTVNNSSSDAHGYLPKLSGSSDVWLDGTGAWTVPTGGLSTVYDSDVVMQNGITTNNADSDHHGFEPILSGDSNTWLNGKNEWTTPASSGAATTNEYVTTASAGDLSAEVNIPGLAGSADRSGIAGAGVSYEFDSGASPLTWSTAVDVEDVDSTFPSHLYVQDNGAAETRGVYSWSPAGAFDIRCKVSMASEVGTGGTGASIALLVEDSSEANRVYMRLVYNKTNNRYECDAFTFTASTQTQRGSTNTGMGNTVYLRITRDGSNNVSFYWSSDGITWLLIVTQAFTFTAQKAGLRLVPNSLVANFAVDWIRSNV